MYNEAIEIGIGEIPPVTDYPESPNPTRDASWNNCCNFSREDLLLRLEQSCYERYRDVWRKYFVETRRTEWRDGKPESKRGPDNCRICHLPVDAHPSDHSRDNDPPIMKRTELPCPMPKAQLESLGCFQVLGAVVEAAMFVKDPVTGELLCKKCCFAVSDHDGPSHPNAGAQNAKLVSMLNNPLMQSLGVTQMLMGNGVAAADMPSQHNAGGQPLPSSQHPPQAGGAGSYNVQANPQINNMFAGLAQMQTNLAGPGMGIFPPQQYPVASPPPQQQPEAEYDGPALRSARPVNSRGEEKVPDADANRIFAKGTMTRNGQSVPITMNKNQFKNLFWMILCPCLLLCPSVCDDEDTDNWRMNPIAPKKGNGILACRLLCCPCLEPKPTSTTGFSGHEYQLIDVIENIQMNQMQ